MSSVLLYVMWLSPISVIPRLCCIHRLSSKLVNVQCVRVILYIYILPPMLYFHLYFSSCTVFFRYNSRDYYERCPELRQAIDQIASGYFSPEDSNMFRDIAGMLLDHDR